MAPGMPPPTLALYNRIYHPPEKWGSREGGPERGLVGFLWGAREAFVGSRVGCSGTSAPASGGRLVARPEWLAVGGQG